MGTSYCNLCAVELERKESDKREKEAFIAGYEYGWTDYVAGDQNPEDAHTEWRRDDN